MTSMMEKALFGLAKQWIAGDTIDDALRTALISYKSGMDVIINKLGEHHTSKNLIENTVFEYRTIIDSFRKWKVGGGISIKPTQIGLMKSKKECLQNLESLILLSSKSQTFVWIDMESSDNTDETIQMYEYLFSKYERVGIAIQANLLRSKNDIIDLLSIGGKIRLVKGAYRERPNIAFKSKGRIDDNYLKLMHILFERGNEFGIATHDSVMIDNAIQLSKRYNRRFEFQMLRGIRDDLKLDLIRNRFSLAEYIPYGTNWLPYSIRRLKERKRNILLLGSSFIAHHKI